MIITNGRRLPACVKTHDFSKEKDGAVGKVYKFTYNGLTDKVKGFYYIGRRKFEDEDKVETYSHSSSHPQFNYYYELGSKSSFHYETLFTSDDWSAVKDKEAELLEQCVGLDDKCWNLHKPGRVGVENDEMLDNLYDRITQSMKKDENGNYNGPIAIDEVLIEEILKVPFYQTRDTEYLPGLVKKVTRAVNDIESIENTNPAILLKNREASALLDHDGGDLYIDGNNTIRGISKSKLKNKKGKVMTISEEEQKFLTDIDIDALTGYLNKRPDDFSEPNNEQKGIDYCITENGNGNKYNSKRVKGRLTKMGFDSTEVSSIITDARKTIRKNQLNKKNKTLITYGDGKYVDKENKVIKAFLKKHHTIDSGGTKMAEVLRSGSVVLDRLQDKIALQQIEWLEDDNETRDKVTHFTLGVTHSDADMRVQWNDSPTKKQKFDRVIEHYEDSNYDVTFKIVEITPVFRDKTAKIN
tara:strand:- start:36 stop:1442 length:1407 start_codon:yes stop_codon:yes gene_type:complete